MKNYRNITPYGREELCEEPLDNNEQSSRAVIGRSGRRWANCYTSVFAQIVQFGTSPGRRWIGQITYHIGGLGCGVLRVCQAVL